MQYPDLENFTCPNCGANSITETHQEYDGNAWRTLEERRSDPEIARACRETKEQPCVWVTDPTWYKCNKCNISIDTMGKDEEHGYVRNCFLYEWADSEALFTLHEDGRVIPRLDGYAILPIKTYEDLKESNQKLKEALIENKLKTEEGRTELANAMVEPKRCLPDDGIRNLLWPNETIFCEESQIKKP